MIEVTSAFVLSLMVLAVPTPTPDHRATFDTTAEAIAKASNASPLFEGDYGAEKTAALLVALGEFESGLRPAAEGDCEKTKTKTDGTCAPGGHATSFCLLQINQSNLKSLGVTREELLENVETCVSTGLRMLRTSFQICRKLPLEDRLRWYASGQDACPGDDNADAARKSRHRVRRAMWLFATATKKKDSDTIR
jgi:hypothetical protein